MLKRSIAIPHSMTIIRKTLFVCPSINFIKFTHTRTHTRECNYLAKANCFILVCCCVLWHRLFMANDDDHGNNSKTIYIYAKTYFFNCHSKIKWTLSHRGDRQQEKKDDGDYACCLEDARARWANQMCAHTHRRTKAQELMIGAGLWNDASGGK